jgi:hypothetical protein
MRVVPVHGAQHRPRGPPSQSPVADQNKAFFLIIIKRSVPSTSTDPRSAAGEGAPTIAALSFPFIAVTTRGSAPGSRWCVRLCRLGIVASVY